MKWTVLKWWSLFSSGDFWLLGKIFWYNFFDRKNCW